MQNNPKRRLGRIMILAGLCIILTASIAGGLYIKQKIGPNMEKIGSLKAQGIVNTMTNEIVENKFQELSDPETFLIINRDGEGRVTSVQSDTKAMNILSSSVMVELQRRYDNCSDIRVSVPLGSLLGSKVISQTGIDVELKIMPVSVSTIDFCTKMHEYGINQTKYKVYMVLQSKVEILAPFSGKTFTIKNNIPVAEAVIIGDVPENYVFVPEDELTNTLH